LDPANRNEEETLTQEHIAGTGAVVVIGGTAGLGRDLAQHYADQGREVVITGRDRERAAKVAAEIGGATRGIAVDLTKLDTVAEALADIGAVEYLALCAFFRDRNAVRELRLDTARDLLTIKPLGYVVVVNALHTRLLPTGSILIYGGGLKDRPTVGTLTVAIANASVEGLTRALAVELKPIRVNAIHPGMVVDSPFWTRQPDEFKEGIRARTPTGRYTTMREVTQAAVGLLENPAINAASLAINGGAMLG
jgi:NAD(P)-dependent dehydrogenase (short-subunit alcohol dehydrogenase family)